MDKIWYFCTVYFRTKRLINKQSSMRTSVQLSTMICRQRLCNLCYLKTCFLMFTHQNCRKYFMKISLKTFDKCSDVINFWKIGLTLIKLPCSLPLGQSMKSCLKTADVKCDHVKVCEKTERGKRLDLHILTEPAGLEPRLLPLMLFSLLPNDNPLPNNSDNTYSTLFTPWQNRALETRLA